MQGQNEVDDLRQLLEERNRTIAALEDELATEREDGEDREAMLADCEAECVLLEGDANRYQELAPVLARMKSWARDPQGLAVAAALQSLGTTCANGRDIRHALASIAAQIPPGATYFRAHYSIPEID